MATATLPDLRCRCQGRRHLVCRRWAVTTARDTLAQFSAPISAPPARPTTWNCGCGGRAHFVCDPTWAAIKEHPVMTPLRRLTLKAALREGLTLRPHTAHTFRTYPCNGTICDCGARVQTMAAGFSEVVAA